MQQVKTSKMSNQKTQEKKKLESYLSVLKGEMNALKAQISNLNKELTAKENAYQATSQIIASLTPKKLEVSDHAVLRYLERVSGVSVDEVAERICDAVGNHVQEFGDGQFPVDGFSAVVKNNRVITIK